MVDEEERDSWGGIRRGGEDLGKNSGGLGDVNGRGDTDREEGRGDYDGEEG